jgi:hypothetical protein
MIDTPSLIESVTDDGTNPETRGRLVPFLTAARDKVDVETWSRDVVVRRGGNATVAAESLYSNLVHDRCGRFRIIDNPPGDVGHVGVMSNPS